MVKRGGVKKQDLTPERVAEWLHVLDPANFDSRLREQLEEERQIYDALKLTAVDPLLDARLNEATATPIAPLDHEPGEDQELFGTSAADEEGDEYGLY
jgi:hypothetical protein